MWRNPTREREIYYSASGKYSTAANTQFQPREITYNTQTIPPKSASIFVKSVLLNDPPRNGSSSKTEPTVGCTNCFVRPTAQNSLEIRAKTCLEICALSSCCTDCTDPYSTTSNSRKITQPQNIKSFLGICALAPLGNVPSLLLTFLSQAYLENLSQSPPLIFSMCLAHYPMHSFINLKMTFSLQSVFSPSPTLNPKAKIRSCLFQDQGS